MGVIEEILNKLQQLSQKIDMLDKEKPTLKGVLNAEETAAFLKISENKVYNLWAMRKLGYVKIGSRKVSTVNQIEEYVKENSINSVKGFSNKLTIL